MLYSRKILFTVLLLVSQITLFSQNCLNTLSGFVFDYETDEVIKDVDIQIGSHKTKTDNKGFFQINNLCKKEYALITKHHYFKEKTIKISIKGNSSINIYLENHFYDLKEVSLVDRISTQLKQSIDNEEILENSNKTLSGMLENMVGVSSLSSGGGISKPVVHGLYGNRLTILNNGISQRGQQWGNDHSPEIDPLVANKISVIKGVNSLEYSGSNIGSVILIEPKEISTDEKLTGGVNYFFESNGRTNGVNLQLEEYNSVLPWRVNGTFKKGGDKSTADYFLRNTGNKEINLSLQLEKEFNDKFFMKFYFSTFNTILGVFRGSHLGNLTDLEESLSRDVPFFTEDNFTYKISTPKQKVSHNLLKLKGKYLINEYQNISIILSSQINNREEYDTRRGDRSNIPALELNQINFFSEIKYNTTLKENWEMKSGVQLDITDNTNNPETGILPLIPDYISTRLGTFVTTHKRFNNILLELGARYDLVDFSIKSISKNLPRKIISHNNLYHNINTSFGINYDITPELNILYNIGYSNRNPAINELHSYGLHQGVGGIEEGNINLETEKSLKYTINIKYTLMNNMYFDFMAYYQNMMNYIFLSPQKESVLTIRGAFPLFVYEQTNARIYGFDLSIKGKIFNKINRQLTYSYIQGDDLTNNLTLINIPANNITGILDYDIGNFFKFKNINFKVYNKIVFRKKGLLESQDFLLPPDGYYLLGAKISTDIILNNSSKISFFIKGDNLLNSKYRDYMNRLRYFADDMGINITSGILFRF